MLGCIKFPSWIPGNATDRNAWQDVGTANEGRGQGAKPEFGMRAQAMGSEGVDLNQKIQQTRQALRGIGVFTASSSDSMNNVPSRRNLPHLESGFTLPETNSSTSDLVDPQDDGYGYYDDQDEYQHGDYDQVGHEQLSLEQEGASYVFDAASSQLTLEQDDSLSADTQSDVSSVSSNDASVLSEVMIFSFHDSNLNAANQAKSPITDPDNQNQGVSYADLPFQPRMTMSDPQIAEFISLRGELDTFSGFVEFNKSRILNAEKSIGACEDRIRELSHKAPEERIATQPVSLLHLQLVGADKMTLPMTTVGDMLAKTQQTLSRAQDSLESLIQDQKQLDSGLRTRQRALDAFHLALGTYEVSQADEPRQPPLSIEPGSRAATY